MDYRKNNEKGKSPITSLLASALIPACFCVYAEVWKMKKKVAQYSNLGAALVSVRSKHGKSRQGRHDSTPGCIRQSPYGWPTTVPCFSPLHTYPGSAQPFALNLPRPWPTVTPHSVPAPFRFESMSYQPWHHLTRMQHGERR